MNSRILNIVKFTVTDQVGDHKTNWNQAAIFYRDGSVKMVSVSEAAKEANRDNIRISEVTTEQLTKNYENYCKIPNFDFGGQATQTSATGTKKGTKSTKQSQSSQGTKTKTAQTKSTQGTKNSQKIKSNTSSAKKTTSTKKKQGFFRRVAAGVTGFFGGMAMGAWHKLCDACDWATVHILNRLDERKAERKKAKKEKKSLRKRAKDYVVQSVSDRKNGKARKKKKGKRGFGKRLATAATAVALAFGLGSCANPDVAKNAQPEQTELTQDELANLTDEELLQMINSGELSLEQVKEMLASGEIKNDILDNLSYEQLLQVTNSEIQQQEMSKIGNYLDYFNGTFADKYVEANHPGVRAVLTWEEVNAINLAYNDFSKEEIRAIFNGEEVSSADFTNSYKEATLQLMGAFVLETRDMPVNLDSLLNTEEGRAFYQKYNELFLRCKETTGQEQLNAVNAFYQELYKDFPISDEVREVGISHSETRDDIESYKLSVTPMVAAAEIMFQNLEIDHTLSDKAVAYFNDLGLCEFAQGKYERAEQIMLCSEDDKSLPTYQQFMNAKVKELTDKNIYFVSDKNRDISQYDLFQEWVNGHFNLDANGNFVIGGSVSQSITTKVVDTYTTTDTTYHTETTRTETSDRNKAVSMAGEDAVSRAEAEVDKQFAAENEAAKAEGEAQAAQNQQQMQEEADKEAEEIREEIAQDDQDFQDKIDDANNQIDENNKDQNTGNDKPVNEGDLGHGADFDDQHSNEQGDLDNSVGNITTDGTGAGSELPDPNESGAEFDQEQPDYSNQPEGTFTAGEVDGQTFIEYEEPVAETVNYSTTTESYTESTVTNEQIADAIVEDMALNSTGEEEVFVYTK